MNLIARLIMEYGIQYLLILLYRYGISWKLILAIIKNKVYIFGTHTCESGMITLYSVDNFSNIAIEFISTMYMYYALLTSFLFFY